MQNSDEPRGEEHLFGFTWPEDPRVAQVALITIVVAYRAAMMELTKSVGPAVAEQLLEEVTKRTKNAPLGGFPMDVESAGLRLAIAILDNAFSFTVDPRPDQTQ